MQYSEVTEKSTEERNKVANHKKDEILQRNEKCVVKDLR